MKGTPVHWLVSCVVLAGLCSGVGRAGGAGQDKVKGESSVLKPRLIVGSESVIQAESKMAMKLPTEDLSGDQRIEMALEYRLNISQSGDGGEKLAEFEVLSIRVDMQMPGMAIRYDSRDPASRDAPLGEPFRKLINAPVQMVYDEKDEFVKMASTEAFSGGGNSPFGMAIGPDQVKQMILSSMTKAIPEEAVARGDSWTYRMGIPIAGMGEMDCDLKFVYAKDETIEEQKCAMIEISGSIHEASAGGEPGSEAAERRADEGLESSKFTGTMAVEKVNRLIRESETTMEMVVKMPSPLGGDQILVPIRQHMRSSVLSFRQLR